MDVTSMRICTFRYALGRSTYIVSEVVDELIEHWDEFKVWERDMMVNDIKHAIKLGVAGMEMDVKEWQRVLECNKEAGDED